LKKEKMSRVLLGLLVVWLMQIKPVIAADNGGIYLSPPFEEIEINNEKSEVEFELEIGNNSQTSQVFDLSVVDFGSLDESGGVAFLTTNTDNSQKKYALASWIVLEKSEVIVAFGEKEKVKVTILNKESLSPGGHYGAVLVTYRNEERPEGDKVGINQSMASLIYVQKSGGETKNLILRNVNWKDPLFRVIKKVELRFENNGNVHLVPRGKIEISYLGKLVAKGIINEGSAIILPESFRRLEVEIDWFSKWKWPGIYSVEIDYRFDGNETFKKDKNSFFYVGIEGIILVMLSGFLVVYFWRKYR
jgi:hypothetical protein